MWLPLSAVVNGSLAFLAAVDEIRCAAVILSVNIPLLLWLHATMIAHIRRIVSRYNSAPHSSFWVYFDVLAAIAVSSGSLFFALFLIERNSAVTFWKPLFAVRVRPWRAWARFQLDIANLTIAGSLEPFTADHLLTEALVTFYALHSFVYVFTMLGRVIDRILANRAR